MVFPRLRALLESIGWHLRAPDRTIWFVIDDPARILEAAALARRLDGRLGRVDLLVLSAAKGVVPMDGPLHWTTRPIAFGPAAGMALRRTRARAVVRVGPETRLSATVGRAARRLGVAGLSADGAGLEDALRAAMRENPRNRRFRGPIARLASAAFGDGPAGRLARLRLDRIADLEDLKRRLGRPRMILCLGSGPSSNDPAALAAAAEADAVFRVKHRWLDEGRIRRADVVFTGASETARRLPEAILMAQDRRAAARIFRDRFWRLRRERLRLGVVADVAPGFSGVFPDGARLTNGAAMLSTAVALEPEKLVVAGVDLYAHPDGAYPGDRRTANAYAPAHDAARERAHALAMLEVQFRRRGPAGLEVIGPLAALAAAEFGEETACPSYLSAASPGM